ncbi:MAG TPA: polysaccharide deacetylase family protein [Cyclobacteriaceae bacterium]|nr:polysaccharide deacetylase family protein [Cyclobacteriaceae bacterium]
MTKYFHYIFSGTILLIIVCGMVSCNRQDSRFRNWKADDFGAYIRTDTVAKEINLVFTGHEFADGAYFIKDILSKHGIKASFFLTGDFYRNPEFKTIIGTLAADGHYLGAHSDRHLLYCSWEKRDSLLVTRDEFMNDIRDNYAELKKFGIEMKDAMFFMPPYEWYNRAIAGWTREAGLTLVNFSPGTSSNQDWTYPGLGSSYISSDTIYNRILAYEKKNGLNGFILLTHIGTDPARKDKFYYRLDELIGELTSRGYSFRRIDQ